MINKNFYITHSGQIIYPKNIQPNDIHLEDIAHHLTNVQRFGGALPLDKRYSVAEHSILMAKVALKQYGKWAAKMTILHDATEAYFGDVITALKVCLPDYTELEKKLDATIATKYNISGWDRRSFKPTLKGLDQSILISEVQALFPERIDIFRKLYPLTRPLDVDITGNKDPFYIKREFLLMCSELGISDE